MKTKTVGSVGERNLIKIFSEIFSQRGAHSIEFLEIPNFFSKTPDSFSYSADSNSVYSNPDQYDLKNYEKNYRTENNNYNDLFSGKNDDCATLDLNLLKKNMIVCGTDMLHEKTDFPEKMNYWKRGWMTAAVNLSDIASMGAEPFGFFLSTGLPEDMPLNSAIEFAKGVRDCNSVYNSFVAGGDTDSHQEFTAVVTAIGNVSKDKCLKRSGASHGDYICITGYPGLSAVALDLILENFSKENPETCEELKQKDKKGNYDSFLNNLYLPVPRVFESKIISDSGIATSMTDTSDSLAISLHNLSNASGLGFKIFESLIPISDDLKYTLKSVFNFSENSFESSFDNSSKNSSEVFAKDLNSVIYDYIMFGGGDFELLFTVDPSKVSKTKSGCFLDNSFFNNASEIQNIDSEIFRFDNVSHPKFMSHKYPCPVSIIGYVTDESPEVSICRGGNKIDNKVEKLKLAGYSSF